MSRDVVAPLVSAIQFVKDPLGCHAEQSHPVGADAPVLRFVPVHGVWDLSGIQASTVDNSRLPPGPQNAFAQRVRQFWLDRCATVEGNELGDVLEGQVEIPDVSGVTSPMAVLGLAGRTLVNGLARAAANERGGPPQSGKRARKGSKEEAQLPKLPEDWEHRVAESQKFLNDLALQGHPMVAEFSSLMPLRNPASLGKSGTAESSIAKLAVKIAKYKVNDKYLFLVSHNGAFVAHIEGTEAQTVREVMTGFQTNIERSLTQLYFPEALKNARMARATSFTEDLLTRGYTQTSEVVFAIQIGGALKSIQVLEYSLQRAYRYLVMHEGELIFSSPAVTTRVTDPEAYADLIRQLTPILEKLLG